MPARAAGESSMSQNKFPALGFRVCEVYCASAVVRLLSRSGYSRRLGVYGCLVDRGVAMEDLH